MFCDRAEAQLLRRLQRLGSADIASTADGFLALGTSLADLLLSRGIDSLPGQSGAPLECGRFFDDWYLYRVPGRGGDVFSLFKLREQEREQALGIHADGDTPGVTVSFVAFPMEILERCLDDPSMPNKAALADAIDRVTARKGQLHHPDLKRYFLRPEAEGPYRIAELYVHHAASFGKEGTLPVPDVYAAACQDPKRMGNLKRIFRFLERNNSTAGRVICDHRNIYIRDTRNLTEGEALAILAVHTGNTSFHSFAAEVRFHAMFLCPLARVRIPLLGCPYDSAVRADMSVDDREFAGPRPYYRENSLLVRKQRKCHGGKEM